MKKNTVYLLAAIAFMTAVMTLFSGCSTPQERSGVSPIPFNAQQQSDTRPFGGSF